MAFQGRTWTGHWNCPCQQENAQVYGFWNLSHNSNNFTFPDLLYSDHFFFSCYPSSSSVEEEQETKCGQLEFERDEVVCEEPFKIVLTRTNSRSCFYSTLNLKVLRNFFGKTNCISIVKEECMDHKAELAHVGSKLLPIHDTAGSSSMDTYKSDVQLNRKRAMSRMKELIRWAAATKSEKGANKRWKVLLSSLHD